MAWVHTQVKAAATALKKKFPKYERNHDDNNGLFVSEIKGRPSEQVDACLCPCPAGQDHPHLSCLLGLCKECGVERKLVLAPEELNTTNSALSITYSHYEYVDIPKKDGTTSRRLQPVTHRNRPVGELFAKWAELLQMHGCHCHMAKLLAEVSKERNEHCNQPGNDDVEMTRDFQESLTAATFTEIQAEHWCNTSVSIECSVVEGAGDGDIVSTHWADSNLHTSDVVHYNLLQECSELIKQGVIKEESTVLFVSMDGCAAQYKGKKAFYAMSRAVAKLGIPIGKQHQCLFAVA